MWKKVHSTEFDWNQDGKNERLIMEIPEKWIDPGDYTRITLQMPGRPDFVLTNESGWVLLDSSYQHIQDMSLVKSDYFSLLPITPQGFREAALFLFGYAYGSSFGELTIIALDETGKPRVLFQKEFSIEQYRDLDNDNAYEIIGHAWLSETIGPNFAAYNPELIYSFKKAKSGGWNIFLNEPLSKKSNIEKYGDWGGTNPTSDYVMISDEDGKWIKIMKTDQARQLYNYHE